MKWLKTVVLTAAMAVVAYGVWSTLTRGPKQEQDNSLSSAPPFKAKKTDADEGKHSPDHVVAPDESGEKAPPMLDENPPADGNQGEDSTGASPDADAAAPSGVGERYQPQDPGVESGMAVATDHGPTTSAPTAADAEYGLAMQQVETLLQQGRLAEAHLAISHWYPRHGELSNEVRTKMVDLLDRLTGTVVYSRDHFLQPAHIVLEGETGEQIAQKYNVPWELLAKINGVQDPSLLKAGDELKVVAGPFTAEIDTQSYELVLYLPDGRYAGRFVIGVGGHPPTKPGEYQVTLKMENPPYNDIPGGDPQNPLGKLLVQVGSDMGIHGTNDPATLGKQCEKGCISLSEQDIDDVYDILAKGSTVKIVR